MFQEMLAAGSGGGIKTYEHIGTLTHNARVDCGFKARIIMIHDDNYYNGRSSVCYNSDVSTTTFSLQWNGTAYTQTIGSDAQIGEVGDTYFILPNGNIYSSSAQIIAME